MINKFLEYLRKIKHSRDERMTYNRFAKSATLLGDKHFFSGTGSCILCWGANKENVILRDHSEMFGKILCYSDGKVQIGEWVKIGFNSVVNCVCSITIGANTAIANNVTIIDHNTHPINPTDRLLMRHTAHGSLERQPMWSDSKAIVIGQNVWIGSGVRIQKGVTIGDNSVIGANSVVTKDIPANCIAVGMPARVVKMDIDKTTTSVFPIPEEVRKQYTAKR